MDAAAISSSLLEGLNPDGDLVREARAYIQRGRSLLFERHRAGATGAEIVSAYTTMVDRLICRLFEVASRDFISRYPSLNPYCALIAQGGYGRRELSPYSDIDLLFLHAWKPNAYVESVAEKVLYTLWDAGLQVGHATRSVAESIRLASRDMKVKTALIDGRYLCGHAALYADLTKAVEESLLKKSQDRFVREKLEENRLRHERYGGSVYLLEPDIKDGEGGLRDIQTAFWIAKVKHFVKDLDDLYPRGILQPRDLAELKEAQDFLWRVRNELHFSSGKHQDQLTFEQQEKVAKALGFKDEGGLKAVEAFLRSYYLRASEVNRITSLIIHRAIDGPMSVQSRVRPAGREVRDGVRVGRGVLWVSDPEIFRRDPKSLIRIFADGQRARAKLSHETHELVREHLGLIDERVRRSPEVAAIFREILRWKARVYETLSEMHRCGVLGALIPEFGRLLCMVLHDLYHIYTVDQHSLHLVMELERLRAGEFMDSLPLLTQLAREVEKIEVLYLGLLFHDIGKGYGGGHSERGARMATRIARRFRLNADETAQLVFLVRYHLLFAHTAFRRDLEDEKTFVDFTRTMGAISNLKMLYLLTYADLRSVGPEVWNNWKATLLEDLYLKSLELLEGIEKGEAPREDRRSRTRRIQARLKRRLARRFAPERVREFFECMPDRYFLTTPEDEVPAHFELMEKFSDQVFLSTLRHFPERGFSEIVICAKDRPGLFARITGAFAAHGLDILSARITTRKDGIILDVFRISHAGRPEVVMEARKWARVHATLEGVLDDSVDVARLVEESRRLSLYRRPSPKVPTVIRIDNEASHDFTVVEVYTEDRIGVLFTITYALHQLGLSIHLAKISTNVDQVADVFYVADEHGAKVRDESRSETIRGTLYRSLVAGDEGTAQPAY